MRAGLAAAAIVLAAAVPLYRARAERHRAEVARADAVLLEQVDEGISRAIAEPMEPLAQMMAWDSTGSEGKNR
jgi:hypothetical protein